MVNVTLIAPAGTGGVVQTRQGPSYIINTDGTIVVDSAATAGLLDAGFKFYRVSSGRVFIGSALPADLVSVKAAATPSNGTITIAAQPPHARKLAVRTVLGTPGTTNITAGTLTLVGFDQDGNAVTEVINLAAGVGSSLTQNTKWAYSSLTSGTVAAYAASGGGGGNTLGIGVSNDFGIPAGVNAVNLACVKATKVTKVLGTSNVAADDVASTAVVDKVARTIAPTTAPAASGLVDFELTFTAGIAD